MTEAGKPEILEHDKNEELVDSLDSKYMIHWTPLDKLPKILKRGIYSPVFAKRIKDKDYKKRVRTTQRDVYFEGFKDFVHGHPNKVVGMW